MSKKFISNNKTLIAIILSILIICIIVFTFYLTNSNEALVIDEDQDKQEEIEKVEIEVKEEPFFKEPVNILVLGIDQRGEEKSRTDTIMVYYLDPINKKVKVLSIPRDTYVNIPGMGMDKVNHAHSFGDIELTIETVKEFLGIEIDHYVRINFEGFRRLIDLVGGVTIDVEKNITRGDIYIEKGLRHLNSEEALTYVRDRWDPMGDIDRVKRQQKFIRALVREVNSFEPKWRLIAAIPHVYASGKTDIPLKAAEETLTLLKDIDIDNAELEQIPGSFYNKNGISYWKPDLGKTAELVDRIFKQEKLELELIQDIQELKNVNQKKY